MSSEEKILNDAFGWPTWRGHKLIYCDMCEVWSITCESCNASSCGGGWKKGCGCNKDMIEFCDQAKQPISYLTEEERETIIKFRQLKKLSKISFCAGFLEINWKALKEEGKTCKKDEFFFPELKNYKYKPQYE